MLIHNLGCWKRRALATLTAIVISTTLAAGQTPQNPATPDAARPPRVMPDPYAGKKKLLVIADVQSGFQHDSINHALEVIGKITRDSGIIVSFIRSDSQLVTKSKVTASSTRYARGNNNGRNLSYFDGIFFLGSGEGTMSDQQKADLLSFVHDDGKGLILGHAATIAFYNWPAWGDMIGGFMQDAEYPATGMNAVVVDSTWPGASAFGKNFFWTDQFPQLQPQFVRGGVHTIIALDPAKMTEAQRSKRTDDYFPIVWAKDYGKGRIFSMTAGHNDATYDDPKTQALTLEGIKWALGITNQPAPLDKP
jgi:uncharacterized protein